MSFFLPPRGNSGGSNAPPAKVQLSTTLAGATPHSPGNISRSVTPTTYHHWYKNFVNNQKNSKDIPEWKSSGIQGTSIMLLDGAANPAHPTKGQVYQILNGGGVIPTNTKQGGLDVTLN